MQFILKGLGIKEKRSEDSDSRPTGRRLLPIGSFSFLRSEMRRDLERERRSVVVPEWAVVHSDVSCSDWLLVSLAALCDLNIFLQKSFLPSSAPGICSSLPERGVFID